MKTYFDSGILVKLYTQEENSAEAIELVQSSEPPMVFTRLHESEIKNALRLKCYRKEITPDSLSKSLKSITADFNSGTLERTPMDWNEMFMETERLSNRYALETNCRTLDVFHVACAILLKTKTFVSSDQRQRNLAQKSGLDVRP